MNNRGVVLRRVGLVGALALSLAAAYYARASGGSPSGFAYSGRLQNFGSPVSGSHDFVFELVDGAGATVGCPSDTRSGVAVNAGRFDVANLFGACATLDTVLASQPSLAVRIRVDGQLLSPDQPLGAVPYALVAKNAQSPAASTTASWSSTSTGNAACAAQTANCVSAVNGSGASIACNASSSSGTATCSATSAASGWDTYTTWNNVQSGLMACATAGGNCIGAYDGSGNDQSCTAFTSGGRARCLKVGASDFWDKAVATVNTATTGAIACAKIGAECVDAYQAYQPTPSSSGSSTCGAGVGGPSWVAVFRCKTAPSTGAWDQIANWSNTSGVGVIECAKRNADCVDVLYSNGTNGFGQWPCTTGTGGGNYDVVARCKTRTGATWDQSAQWGNTSAVGSIECAKIGADCVDVWYSNTSTSAYGQWPCGTGTGGSGYSVLARCKTRTGTAWDSTATWNNTQLVGVMECAKIGAECVDVWYSNTSTSAYGEWPCDKGTGGSGYSVLARCKTRTGATWDTIAQWSNTAQYGSVECARVNAECTDVWYANTASTSFGSWPCTSTTGGSGYSVLARCRRATVAANGWSTSVSWSNVSSTGNAQCAAIGGTCVSVLNTSNGATQACGDTFGSGGGGIAKCNK